MGWFKKRRERKAEKKAAETPQQSSTDPGEVIDEGITTLISLIKNLPEKKFESQIKHQVLDIAENLNTKFHEASGDEEFKRNWDMLDNVLMVELKKIKEELKTEESKHKLLEYLFDKLEDVITSPTRTAVFLKGAEKEAGYVLRKDLDEFKQKFNKISAFLNKNFDKLISSKMNPEELKKIIDFKIKRREKKQIINNFVNVNKTALHLLDILEKSKSMKYSPVYEKLTFFCWNIMILYEKLESVLDNDLSEDGGDFFAKLFEKYNKWFYNESIKVADYVTKKTQAFKAIYEDYLLMLKFFKEITETIGIITPFLQKLANLNLSQSETAQALQKIQREMQDDTVLMQKVNAENTQQEITTLTQSLALPQEQDAIQRFGKITLISTQDTQYILKLKTSITETSNKMSNLLKKLNGLFQNTPIIATTIQEIIKIYNEIKTKIVEDTRTHQTIIKNYDKNLRNINQTIINYQILYGIQNIPNSLKVEKNPEVILTPPKLDSIDTRGMDDILKKQVIKRTIQQTDFGKLSKRLNQ